MKCPQDLLPQLGSLIMDGKLEDLRLLMLTIWEPGYYLDEEDVDLLTLILRGIYNIHGEKSKFLYATFSDLLKSLGERRWLSTLALRAEIVEMYEGFQNTLEWLKFLGKQTPPPNDGVISLVIGKLYFHAEDYITAKNYFLHSVEQSLLGIEWFRLDALNEMSLCLAKLGESRLAFEYARTTCIESFKLGRTLTNSKMGEYDLYLSIYALALIFGQIEYAINIRLNLANRFRKQGMFSASSEFTSDVGFRLAQIGVKEDAVTYIRDAAQDAEKGLHPFDPPFAAALYLLAIYLKEEPIKSSHLEQALEFSQRFSFQPMADAISKTWKHIKYSAEPLTKITNLWQQVVTAYDVAIQSSVKDEKIMKLLVGVHTAALVSRYITENGKYETEDLIERAIAMSPSKEAIFIFVREKYINKLMQQNYYKQAIEICKYFLEQKLLILERFTIRDLIARCYLALSDKKQAYLLARLALSDWHRILEGLYTKQLKLYWLKRGAACLSCALESIRESISWMTEDERRKELFNLTELQKARLASDMMTQSGHIPGVYDISKTVDKHGLSEGFLFSQFSKYPEWMPVCLLQMSPLFSDGMNTIVHHDSGDTNFIKIDLNPLRSMLQLPIDPDKQLLATASPLCFEGYDELYRNELCADLKMFLSSENKNESQ